MNTYNCAFEDDVDAEFDWDDAFQCEYEMHFVAAEEFAAAESDESDVVILVRNRENGAIHRCCLELKYSTYEIKRINQE